MCLEDNGRGFPVEPLTRGIGLQAMREHAMDLGGSCDITSSPEGVRICVRLPLMAD
jgi:signal transduction histidine kinase